MHAYENEWFKNDESFSHTSERDSLDENALNNEEMMNEANTNQRSEDKPYYIEPRISTISRYELATFVICCHLFLIKTNVIGHINDMITKIEFFLFFFIYIYYEKNSTHQYCILNLQSLRYHYV